mmetsp:Transcript_48316/g.109772  ORF Transcript_48316/g.109772 Transcript_48316/m.109772 type:complete len:203 (+) Transcript_48316:216-824(+)
MCAWPVSVPWAKVCRASPRRIGRSSWSRSAAWPCSCGTRPTFSHSTSRGMDSGPPTGPSPCSPMRSGKTRRSARSPCGTTSWGLWILTCSARPSKTTLTSKPSTSAKTDSGPITRSGARKWPVRREPPRVSSKAIQVLGHWRGGPVGYHLLVKHPTLDLRAAASGAARASGQPPLFPPMPRVFRLAAARKATGLTPPSRSTL